MIVGAHCRDILRSSLSQESGLRTTEDIDFGLALADWAAYAGLTSGLEPTGNTGIRYKAADVATDLIPFGELERPAGTVDPPARHEPISVWGFTEVFEASRPLVLPSAGTIRIPTLAGYAALKLAHGSTGAPTATTRMLPISPRFCTGTQSHLQSSHFYTRQKTG
jgi:predicted nucleotidyltransferase